MNYSILCIILYVYLKSTEKRINCKIYSEFFYYTAVCPVYDLEGVSEDRFIESFVILIWYPELRIS